MHIEDLKIGEVYLLEYYGRNIKATYIGKNDNSERHPFVFKNHTILRTPSLDDRIWLNIGTEINYSKDDLFSAVKYNKLLGELYGV